MECIIKHDFIVMDNFPKLILFDDYNCDGCGYSATKVNLENMFLYFHHEIRPMYMISDYSGKVFCHSVSATMSVNGANINENTTINVAYNYCQLCIEKALYDHYDIIFVPINHTEILEEIHNQYNMIPQYASDCSCQIFDNLSKIKTQQIKETNINKVLYNIKR